VIGYLAAKWLKTEMWESISSRWVVKGIGVAAIVLGIIMSGHNAPAWLLRTYNHLTVFEELPMRADDFHFFSQYGAILIFFGVLVLPAVQQVLAGRVGRALGRFSFSLYLVHFPILMTLTAWLIVWFQPMGRGPDIVFSSFCGLGVTTVTAILFERLVDRPATELSRRIRLFAPDKSRRPGFGRQTSPSEYRDAD
jgi:peptidoglycan/LPS O-acetylase OafA/YrhL